MADALRNWDQNESNNLLDLDSQYIIPFAKMESCCTFNFMLSHLNLSFEEKYSIRVPQSGDIGITYLYYLYHHESIFYFEILFLTKQPSFTIHWPLIKIGLNPVAR